VTAQKEDDVILITKVSPILYSGMPQSGGAQSQAADLIRLMRGREFEMWGSISPVRPSANSVAWRQGSKILMNLEPQTSDLKNNQVQTNWGLVDTDWTKLTPGFSSYLEIASAAPIMLKVSNLIQSAHSLYDQATQTWITQIPVDTSVLGSSLISDAVAFDVRTQATSIKWPEREGQISITALKVGTQVPELNAQFTLANLNAPQKGDWAVTAFMPEDHPDWLDPSTNPDCAFFFDFEGRIAATQGQISATAFLRTTSLQSDGLSWGQGLPLVLVKWSGSNWQPVNGVYGLETQVTAGQAQIETNGQGSSVKVHKKGLVSTEFAPLVLPAVNWSQAPLEVSSDPDKQSLSILPYTGDQLTVSTGSLLNWWNASIPDLASWAEDWTLSVLVKLPEARLCYDHTRVDTTQGPLWQRHLASEGLKIQFDRLIMTLSPATELVSPDPSLPNFSQSPVYGRVLSLSAENADQQTGWLEKETRITTQTASQATNPWVLLQLRKTGSSVEVLMNGVSLLKTTIKSARSATDLILQSFQMSPLGITDSRGEVTLLQPWPNDGVTQPNYTVNQKSLSGYPSNYVGVNPVLGQITLDRGQDQVLSDLALDPTVTTRTTPQTVNWATVDSLNPSDLQVSYGQTQHLVVTVRDPQGALVLCAGPANIWWRCAEGDVLLGSAPIVNGQLSIAVTPAKKGTGLLFLENQALNLAHGFTYENANPLNLTVF
jgi:hypothetical protein